MPTKTIIVLPSPDYDFFRWQVASIAYYVGKDAAITALRQTPGLNARMLALGLSVYVRGEPGYREKLRAAVENDPSEEAQAILALLPPKPKRKAKKLKCTLRSIHSANSPNVTYGKSSKS